MIENLEIRPNVVNGGICATFVINGSKYFADLAYTWDHGNECMIFAFDENDNIDWLDLYVKRDIPITESTLRECIDEFDAKCNEEGE